MDWFTSDTHFGHAGVIRYCARPFASVAEMNEHMVAKWERYIQPDDTIYLLGDFSFLKFNQMSPYYNLPGRKILVQGNHDKYSDTQYQRLGFQVFQELKIRIAGVHVTLSHYPYAPKADENASAHDLRYLDRRPIDRGGWLLHGHVHEKWKQRGRMINVGVDVWGFNPVSAVQIESLINKKPTY